MSPRSARLPWARALPALVVTLALGHPAPAHADDTAVCLRTNENSQKLRREKKLRDAAQELKICSQPSCPSAIQKDCAQWLREVEAALPSLSFSAKDAGGGDLTDVRVAMDGQLVVQQLDGSAVPIDPGKHTFTFSHEGEPDLTQEILVNEGDKARKVEVRFSSGGVSQAAGAGSRYSPYPFVLGGLGVLGLATGAVLFGVGKGRFPDVCKGELPKDPSGLGQCGTTDDANRANSAVTQSNIGVGLLVGGSVVLAGGIGWFLIETLSKPARTGPGESAHRVRIVPTIGFRSIGVQGSF